MRKIKSKTRYGSHPGRTVIPPKNHPSYRPSPPRLPFHPDKNILTFCRMLECFHEADERLAVRRERMVHLPAAIALIQEAGLYQYFRVLRDGLEIRSEHRGNFFHRGPVLPFHQGQDGDAVVVRRPLEVAFQLLWGLHRGSRCRTIISWVPRSRYAQYSNILQNVGMSFWGSRRPSMRYLT